MEGVQVRHEANEIASKRFQHLVVSMGVAIEQEILPEYFKYRFQWCTCKNEPHAQYYSAQKRKHNILRNSDCNFFLM